MRSYFPFSTAFSFTLISSTMIALSSSHCLLIWMALELNLMSFIPLMSINKTQQETEAAIKYFLAQAMGSALLLLSMLLTFSISYLSNAMYPLLIMSTALFLKMGAAPLHFWFPNVMASLSWLPCLILSTWQKIIPLLLIFFFTTALFPLYTHLISSLSAIVGGLGGMNQTFLRPLLAYSSIGHIGWILATSSVNSSLASMYLLIYVITVSPLMLSLHFLQLSSMRQLISISHTSPSLLPSIMVMFMSLGGLPPLLGFLPKWVALESFSLSPFLSLMALTLIFGSLMNLYYYLNICFSMNLVPSLTTTKTTFIQPPSTHLNLILLASTMLPFTHIFMTLSF
nr:NADH dehydrogenase subunit 2 [Chloeia pocicola]